MELAELLIYPVLLLLGVVALPYLATWILIAGSKPRRFHGLRVYLRPNLGNVCAFSIRLPGLWLIVFDEAAFATGTDDQLRFVIAHELGHILLRHFSPVAAFLPFTRDPIKRAVFERDADLFATSITGVQRDVMGNWRW